MAKKDKKNQKIAKKVAVKKASKPAKKAAKPAAKKAAKPAKKVAKPVAKKAPAKKIVKKAAKPAPKKAVKPVAKKAAKPAKKVAKPVAKKVVKKAPAKPVAKKVVKAVAKKAPAKPVAKAKPVAVKKAAPVAKVIAKPVKAVAQKPVVAPKAQPKPMPVATKPATPVAIKPKVESKALQLKREVAERVFERQQAEEYKAPERYIPKPGEKIRYTDEELQEFKELIIKKLDAARQDYEILRDSLTHRDNNGTDDTSPTFKLLEDGSEVLSKEETQQLAARQQKFIQSLENALIRIENKTYGICRETGRLIPKERLRSVPHATLSMEAKTRQ